MAKKITLSRTDRKLAGVCGGLAKCFGIDPLLVRLGMVALTICSGIGLITYILLWILAPLEKREFNPHNSDKYLK